MSGFIKLHRGWRDSRIFRGEFSRADAWVWLIENACWKPTKFDIRGKTVELQRGQLCASREQLAKAWKWAPSAVERFLTRLQTEQMIERQTGQGKSVITICNYSKYQDRETETGQEGGQPTGQESDRNRTAKEEGQEGKEEKNTHYAFFGRTIRLNANDLDRWRARYHAVADIEAELGSLDDWLQGQPEQSRKDWFYIVSGALNKKHQAAIREQAANENGGLRPGGIGI